MSAETDIAEPTTRDERDRRRLTLNARMPTERFCLRLMDQVDALEKERDDLRERLSMATKDYV